MNSLVLAYRWSVALILMLLSGTLCAILVSLSFGYLRNFTAKWITKYSSRIIMRVMGFRYILPDIKDFPNDKVFYTFNHNSYLDIFLLTAIGLPNLRFLLSYTTLKYIPLVISAKAIGTYYVPTKKTPILRDKFFRRITKKVKNQNNSIAGSSEGVHDYLHGIGPFNREVYEMALEAGMSVVPIFIYIPEECNVFKGDKYAKSGTVKLEVLNRIEVKHWSFESLDAHIDEVRHVFVNRFNELNPDHPTK